MTVVIDFRPANCRFRLRDEGFAYPRSSCAACDRDISTLGTQCLNIKVPAVPATPTYGFSDEEQAVILQRPEILADFLRYSQKHGFENAVEHVRLAYFDAPPDPRVVELRDIAQKVLTNIDVPMPEIIADRLNKAATAIAHGLRRPVGQLYHGGNPNRWVILWGPSGYIGTKWRCGVGRIQPADEKFGGKFVRHDGERFTDDGDDATHFSELP